MPKGLYTEISRYPEPPEGPLHPEALKSFQAVLGSFGPIIEPKDLTEAPFSHHAKWVMGRVHAHLQILSRFSEEHREVISRLDCHLIGNWMLNGIAFSDGDCDHIGMTVGGIRNIPAFFEVLLSHPTALTDIGECSKERAWCPDMRAYAWSSDFRSLSTRLAERTNRPDGRLPVDIVRWDTACLLSAIAIDFLVLHELAHILCGHTTFGALKGKPRYEVGSRYDTAEEYEVSQALELHADGSAALMLINLLWNMFRHDADAWQHKYWESRREALYMMLLSVGFLFLIMDQDATRLTHTANDTHPHTLVRLVHVVEILKSNLREVDPDIVASACSDAIGGIGEASEALQIPSAIGSAGCKPREIIDRIQYLSLGVLARVFPLLRMRIGVKPSNQP